MNGSEPLARTPVTGTRERLRIIVLGYIVRGPLGGLAWHHLQYVLGLARLGHDVTFLEGAADHPDCYDPARGVTDHDPSYGLAFAKNAFDRLGLGGSWAYHDAHAAHWCGPCGDRADRLCEDADLLLNLSGVNPARAWWTSIPVRVLIDTDPGFTQVRHLTDPGALAYAHLHQLFFSFGENVGKPSGRIPDDGLPWQPTRQPIVLEAWPVTRGRARARFTTVMQWDSYREVHYAGQTFGMKSASFEPYLKLPRRAPVGLELALGGGSAPRGELRAYGWRVVDPLTVTRDPWTYQEYLRGSKAEFAMAKHGYVVSRSGWFSERSAAYLASGRPVLALDTAFTDILPTGSGLLQFSSPEEALAGIEEIERDYASHCQAAREIAEVYFDASRVMADLLDRVGGVAG